MNELRAVVFDLFGTLVPEFPLRDWDAMLRAMARGLGADEGAFRAEWGATLLDRQTGRLGDMEGNVRAICERLRIDPAPDRIAAALEARAEVNRRLFHPKPETVPVLGWLRANGYATALLSMCAPDAPAMWHASAMAGLIDEPLFSSEVGLRKPDPEFYLLAASRLGVEPQVCLYVGDGAYRELSGAAAVGMRPVLIRDASGGEDQVLRPDADDWVQPSIGSLAEIPELLAG